MVDYAQMSLTINHASAENGTLGKAYVLVIPVELAVICDRIIGL